jgi:hypothetical protein
MLDTLDKIDTLAALDISHPRKSSREIIQNSVDADIWAKNAAFRQKLMTMIDSHAIMKHPIINELNSGNFTLEQQQFFHLEFKHAFAQIFTDALLQLMFTTSQLESRLGAKAKVAARFLLQLNVLDELGFVADSNQNGYCGNPNLAHYVQFSETLKQLNISQDAINAYKPSAEAHACRKTFENQYSNHTTLACILAISETVFTVFCGPWSKSVGISANMDVSSGYHSIHIEQDDGGFIDDDHSEDAWIVLQQAITPNDYDSLVNLSKSWLDTWETFLNKLCA